MPRPSPSAFTNGDIRTNRGLILLMFSHLIRTLDMLLDELFDPRPSEDTPIACDPSEHTEEEFEQHEEKVEGLIADRDEMRKVSGDYAFRFPGTMDYAERILGFVRLERKCCPF